LETVLYNFFVGVPLAAAIWSALLLLAVTAMVALIAFPRRRRTDDAPELPEAERRRKMLSAKAQESSRYAEEVAVAATRAAATAQRRRDEWLAAQEQAEAAWRAYDGADAAARRLARVSALPTPRTPHTPAEYADRERYLHRAAMAACCRRELSVLELSDVLAHRHGWDPRRHPVEQEVVLRRTVRDRLLAGQRSAAARERAAWQVAEVAAVAARSLREEAFTAAGRAYRLRHWLEPESRQSEAAPAVARQPRTVIGWRTARAG
jgi:hypothetical protein